MILYSGLTYSDHIFGGRPPCDEWFRVYVWHAIINYDDAPEVTPSDLICRTYRQSEEVLEKMHPGELHIFFFIEVDDDITLRKHNRYEAYNLPAGTYKSGTLISPATPTEAIVRKQLGKEA